MIPGMRLISDTDLGMRRIQREVAALQGLSARVGVQGTEAAAVHPDSSKTNVEIAAVHEFGDSNPEGMGPIPARSFLGDGLDQFEGKYAHLLIGVLKRAMRSPSIVAGATTGLGLAGTKLVADLQRRMSDHIAPPLSPVTIKLRKWSRKQKSLGRQRGGSNALFAAIALAASFVPLIDTGVLRSSITSTVKKGPL